MAGFKSNYLSLWVDYSSEEEIWKKNVSSSSCSISTGSMLVQHPLKFCPYLYYFGTEYANIEHLPVFQYDKHERMPGLTIVYRIEYIYKYFLV